MAKSTKSPQFFLTQSVNTTTLNRLLKDVALASGNLFAMSVASHGMHRGYARDPALLRASSEKILEEHSAGMSEVLRTSRTIVH